MTIIYIWPDRRTVMEAALPDAPNMRRNFLRVLLHARRFMPFCKLENGDVVVIDEKAHAVAEHYVLLPGVSLPVPGRMAIIGQNERGLPLSCVTPLDVIAGPVSYLDRAAYYMALMRGDYRTVARPLSVRRVCEVIPFPARDRSTAEPAKSDRTKRLAAK